MNSSRFPSLRSALPFALAAVLLGSAWGGAGDRAFAAPPSPSPEPTEEPFEDFEMEAWLDAPLPLEAQAGTTIHIGALVWIRGANEAVRGATLQVRLHPATGDAEPTFDYAHQDFIGHVVADLEVPIGGVGDLEIALPETMCENDVCGPVKTPIAVRGVGPPPGVHLSVLANAVTSPPIEALVTGRPLPFGISVQPKVEWPAPGLDLPSALWLQVRVSRGPIVEDVAANLVDAAAGRYEAPITFDEPGEYVLEAGTRPDADGSDLLPGSVIRVAVEAPRSTPEPELPGTTDETPAWLVPGLIVLALAGLLIASRVTRRR